MRKRGSKAKRQILSLDQRQIVLTFDSKLSISKLPVLTVAPAATQLWYKILPLGWLYWRLCYFYSLSWSLFTTIDVQSLKGSELFPNTIYLDYRDECVCLACAQTLAPGTTTLNVYPEYHIWSPEHHPGNSWEQSQEETLSTAGQDPKSSLLTSV